MAFFNNIKNIRDKLSTDESIKDINDKINEYDSLKNIKNNINKSIDEHAIDEIEKRGFPVAGSWKSFDQKKFENLFEDVKIYFLY